MKQINMHKNTFLIFLMILSITSCTITNQQTYCNSWDKQNIENGGTYREGELLISFNDGITEDQAEQILEKYNDIDLDHQFGNNVIYEIKVPAGEELEWICTLKKEQGVRNVELSYYTELDEE